MKRSLSTLFILGLLLSGCGTAESPQHQARVEDLRQQVQQAQQQAPTASLHFLVENTSVQVGDVLRVRISVANPQNKDLQTVRLALGFDPDKLSWRGWRDENSSFPMILPSENMVEGAMVRAGRASEGVNTGDLLLIGVAEWVVQPAAANGLVTIDALGYSGAVDGLTSVNTVEQAQAINVLQRPQNPEVKVSIGEKEKPRVKDNNNLD